MLAEAKTTRKAIWTARLQHQLWPKVAAHPWFVRNLTVGVGEYKSPTPVKLYIQLGKSLKVLENAKVPAPLNLHSSGKINKGSDGDGEGEGEGDGDDDDDDGDDDDDDDDDDDGDDGDDDDDDDE